MLNDSTTCYEVDNTFGPWAISCRGGFDFTLYFEELILAILPLALILLIVPIRCLYLTKKQSKATRSAHLYLKLTLYGIYFIFSLALIILWSKIATIKTSASVPSAIITLIGCLGLAILSYLEHMKTIKPSTILEGYLFFSLLFDIVRARTLWLQHNSTSIASLFLSCIAVKVGLLLLETCEKKGSLRKQFQNYPSEATSGVFNRSFFWWLNPLFRRGYGNTLLLEDLYGLDKHLESNYLKNLFQSSWSQGTNKTPHALFFMSMKVLKWPLLSAMVPRLSLTAFNYTQPFLLNRAISLSLEPETNASRNDGYGLIGAYILVYVGIAITTGHFQHLTYRAITMARGGLISMLYSKTADLHLTAVDPTASMILMSADIERITTGWQTMHELWVNIIEIGLAIYLLERQLGVACAIPIAVAVVSMVGSLGATGLVMSRQALWLEAIERRIAATTAMLGSMKGVKMCGLTNTLSDTLQELRMDELRISKRFRKLLIVNMSFAYITPIAAPIATFAVYSVISRNGGDETTLDLAKVFTSLSLFTLLADPLQSIIMALATFMGAVGSFHRIQEFLNTESRVDPRQIPGHANLLNHDPAENGRKTSTSSEATKTGTEESLIDVSAQEKSSLSRCDWAIIQDGSFGWENDKEPILQCMNLGIPREKMTMIVGPVGCGKSTLIKAILGETICIQGSIRVFSQEIAFCDQTPWHMNVTVQESIIGVTKLEEPWYSMVVHACALSEDFHQLSRGDQTPIGSKGISLSGGQSQRIALARAIYARKDTIILDDVLSGLDVDTENRVFHNLFGRNGLLRKHNLTVIIATSSAKRLPYADFIISLDKDGKIAEQGPFKDLSSRGGYVSSFNLPPPDWSYIADQPETKEKYQKLTVGNAAGQITEDDLSRRTGDVAIYWYYIKTVGRIPALIFVVAICIFIFCMSFPTIWVKWWGESNAKAPNERLGYYLGIYGMLGALAMIFLIVSCWQMIITMVPRSGESFHWILLKTVLSAPMSFFASTDTGVTINRFSQDLMLIDMELPITALNTFATFVLCIAQVALIGVSSVYAAISFPAILFALFLVQKFYLRTSRQLRFLDLETKSPLYSQFIECLNGLATVRAFGWQKDLEEKSSKLLDQSQKPFYLLFAVQRWLTLVLDLIVAAVATVLIVLVVELKDAISPGFVGVAMLNIILFSQSIKMLLTFWTNLETHIGSIARIKSFTTSAIPEDLDTEIDIPPPSWPAYGGVEFKNTCAEYKKGEPVLRGVSLNIEPGQKVGVCGRTGSGKTSLVLSIFRMIESTGGSIKVDGIDLSTIARHEIRSRIIGVPQDSYLLAGSVRMNADPVNSVTDTAIIDALKAVQLWDTVKEKGGLDKHIEQIFLTHGQKQLFCLARAMLRPGKILILDEATSSVDAKTDELMQHIIREKFSQHTIIAVAHKLDTIIDFDKIALLDDGSLIEFDAPHELLAQKSSAFYNLYHSSHGGQDSDADDQELSWD